MKTPSVEINQNVIIFTFKEKHGSYTVSAFTKKQFCEIVLKKITERNDYGWYNIGEKPESPYDDEFIKNIKNLPTDLQKTVSLKINHYRQELREYEFSYQTLMDIKTSIKEKNGLLAYKCLLSHRDNEYENFEIQVFSKEKNKGTPFTKTIYEQLPE
jgi:hypothetical protein